MPLATFPEMIKVLGLAGKIDVTKLTQGEMISILRAYYSLVNNENVVVVNSERAT